MQKEYGLNPLCVTVNPPLRTELGHKNLENFKKSGATLIEINPPSDKTEFVLRMVLQMTIINKKKIVHEDDDDPS